MINKRHFGKRVAYHRRMLNLSQADLADKMGISPQAISKWETGITLPDIEMLLALSKFFKVSVNELLEDNAIVSHLSSRPFESWNGIAVDTSWNPDSVSAQWEQDMQEEGWIRRNWMDAWNRPGGWADSKYGPNLIGERNRPGDLRFGRQTSKENQYSPKRSSTRCRKRHRVRFKKMTLSEHLDLGVFLTVREVTPVLIKSGSAEFTVPSKAAFFPCCQPCCNSPLQKADRGKRIPDRSAIYEGEYSPPFLPLPLLGLTSIHSFCQFACDTPG